MTQRANTCPKTTNKYPKKTQRGAKIYSVGIAVLYSDVPTESIYMICLEIMISWKMLHNKLNETVRHDLKLYTLFGKYSFVSTLC